MTRKHPQLLKAFGRFSNWVNPMGTLDGGNHFIEVCLDESDGLWVMLHSGSRGSATPSTTISSSLRGAIWSAGSSSCRIAIWRKDTGVVDEIPAAYKDIDPVMPNQADLVQVVHTLKQVICVKG